MKQFLRQKKKFSYMILGAVAVICMGFVMFSTVFEQYDRIAGKNVDVRLQRMAESVDNRLKDGQAEIDLKVIYENASEVLMQDEENRLLLLDTVQEAFIYQKNGEIHIESTHAIKKDHCEYETFCFMKKQQETGQKGTSFCRAVSHSTGEAYKARIAVFPAVAETNGRFTVGVSINYDREWMPLRVTAMGMAGAGLMIIVGVVFLLVILFQMIKINRKDLQEIRLLQEKNAAMEEVNKKMENLAHHQRLELMGMLTSGIAHEFNNMLTPIMGYSMMILEKLPQDDMELYDEILEIYQMSAKAKTVISRLSDLSRKNTGNVFQKISMDELVRRMISTAKSARPERVDVQLELKCPEVGILGNETQLSQLLLNLILNSYHALENTGGTLEILTECDENVLTLTVRDNGCGISREDLSHIFEPFFTTKEAGKGTGLGMAIVAQVVEDHQGSIAVESEENEGTTVSVKFPIKP